MNRDIKPGEVLNVKKKYLKPEFHADRRFRCEDGFGMSMACKGTAVFGAYLSDGERCRVERYMLEEIKEEAKTATEEVRA